MLLRWYVLVFNARRWKTISTLLHGKGRYVNAAIYVGSSFDVYSNTHTHTETCNSIGFPLGERVCVCVVDCGRCRRPHVPYVNRMTMALSSVSFLNCGKSVVHTSARVRFGKILANQTSRCVATRQWTAQVYGVWTGTRAYCELQSHRLHYGWLQRINGNLIWYIRTGKYTKVKAFSLCSSIFAQLRRTIDVWLMAKNCM